MDHLGGVLSTGRVKLGCVDLSGAAFTLVCNRYPSRRHYRQKISASAVARWWCFRGKRRVNLVGNDALIPSALPHYP